MVNLDKQPPTAEATGLAGYHIIIPLSQSLLIEKDTFMEGVFGIAWRGQWGGWLFVVVGSAWLEA